MWRDGRQRWILQNSLTNRGGNLGVTRKYMGSTFGFCPHTAVDETVVNWIVFPKGEALEFLIESLPILSRVPFDELWNI